MKTLSELDQQELDALEAVNSPWAIIAKERKMVTNKFEPALDAGIRDIVILLRNHKVETYASYQGGVGHAYPVPTVRFWGDKTEGFRALAIALQHGFQVDSLRRFWDILDGEPTGPYWEMTFLSIESDEKEATIKTDIDTMRNNAWLSFDDARMALEKARLNYESAKAILDAVSAAATGKKEEENEI